MLALALAGAAPPGVVAAATDDPAATRLTSAIGLALDGDAPAVTLGDAGAPRILSDGKFRVAVVAAVVLLLGVRPGQQLGQVVPLFAHAVAAVGPRRSHHRRGPPAPLLAA